MLQPPSPSPHYHHHHHHHHHHHLALLQICHHPRELHQIHAASIKTGLIHSNPFTYNTIIKTLVNTHHSHDAIALFSNMLSHSTPPDTFSLPCLIKACAHLNAVSEGKQIHCLALKTGLASHEYVQSSLVSFYSKSNDLVCARTVFDRIGTRDLVTWNCLIDGYLKCGEIEVARILFDEMPERDAFTWTSLISGYSKCGEVVNARELFDCMPERSSVSWNAMIDGYMRSGDFVEARKLFDEMPGKNVVTWNSMIRGFEKSGLFETALKVYDMMLVQGMVPNYVTLVSTLSAVSGLALLERGRSIHRYIRINAFLLDGVLGICLIEMYSKCGSIKEALSVFEEIHRKKVGHWTAIIVGLGMHGMVDHALRLFVEMQSIGMKPNAITFVGVLNACSHAGLVGEGRGYFELMRKEYNIVPTMEHYGCLVDLLCRVGCLEEARRMIDSMPMRPNKIIWMSLLSGCRRYGNIEMGEFASRRVIELAPEATGCFVLLSNIYAAAGLWDNVSKLRETMKEKGIRKDPGHSLVEHRGRVHEFVVGDRSHPQADAIYSKIDEMGERLRLAGYTPDISQVLVCVEEGEKEAELAHHSERLAIAFGFINIEPGRPIRIVKNLRVCDDCHNVTKLLSGIYDREIIVRDNSRFHHFRNGSCSCMDFW